MVLSTVLLIMSAQIAQASCLDALDSFVRETCISVPDVLEYNGGMTQAYYCDVSDELSSFVAVFSYDPNIVEAMSSESETCAGGELYLIGEPEDLSVLEGIDRYAESFHR
jgi:hypothetical protein